MGEPKDKTVYVQLIVKACHRAETPLEPTNQGKVYNDEKPMTLEERKAALVALGCIDVPVPMDFLADALSPSACMGMAAISPPCSFSSSGRISPSSPPSGLGSASSPTTR